MDRIQRLITGFKVFHATYFVHRPERYEALANQGQSPEVLIVACSDSRVDPAILLNAEPGELFVIRNVANLVPPYEPDDRRHGTSAALEFGVRDLKVKHIVVLGHSQCGGIRALCEIQDRPLTDREFIGQWVGVAAGACGEEHAHGTDHGAVERAAIQQSIRNLRTFPWVAEAEKAGRLQLHGWWFDLMAGELWELSEAIDSFQKISV